jgi:hypothetical protein
VNKLTKEDLFSLEKYAEIRSEFRQDIQTHKHSRMVAVGPNVTLHFEDQKTMLYQVQEMLRAERIFEAAGIQEELDAYNPLIPDGNNWKATFMIQFDDPEERKVALAQMIGIEKATWVQVENFDPVHPICNEDLERETEEKTSSVHFMRFELSDDMVQAAKNGAAVHVGIDHPAYSHRCSPVPKAIRDSLAGDLC